MLCSKCGRKIENEQNSKRVFEMTPIMYPQAKIWCNDCLKKGRLFLFVFLAISLVTVALFVSLHIGLLQ